MPKKRHFVIAAHGTSGDVYPFIEMAKYLVCKGETVSFLTNPYFEAEVKDNGLTLVPFGSAAQLREVLNDQRMWHPKTGFRYFWSKTIEPNLLSIRQHVTGLAPDQEVVIFSNPPLMTLASLARGAAPDLRIVLFYTSPSIIRADSGKVHLGGPLALPENFPPLLRRLLWSWIDSQFLDVGIVPGLNALRKELGLEPIRHFFPHMQTSADLYVTLFPEWYAPTRPGYPTPVVRGDFLLYVSRKDALTPQLAQFLDAGEPPILFTAGTGNLHAARFFEIALRAVEQLNARAVFLTKFPQQLPTGLPASVLWQEYVSFPHTVPRLSVLVHHGGIGTAAHAISAAVPQLIVPSAYDQFDNARIVTELGVGLSITAGALTVPALVARLSELRSSTAVKSRCLALSRQPRRDRTALDGVLAAV